MSTDLAIFISYAHADQAVARVIAKRLESEGVRVWIDEGQLRIGDSLIDRISQALDDVQFVIAIVSRTAVQSQWCKKELSLAMTGGLRLAGVRVLPLRLGDTEMPPALRDSLYAQVDPADPAAVVPRLLVDARSHQADAASAVARVAELQNLTRIHAKLVDQYAKARQHANDAIMVLCEASNPSERQVAWVTAQQKPAAELCAQMDEAAEDLAIMRRLVR